MGANFNYEKTVKRLEEAIKENYEKLGEAFFEENENAESVSPKYDDIVKEIKKAKADIGRADIAKLAADDLRKCDACGNILSLDSVFCNKCGAKLPELPGNLFEGFEEEIPVVAPEPVYVQPAAKHCIGCGMELRPDAVFCPNCGTRQ